MEIKTQKGNIINRPIQRLYPLELLTDDEDRNTPTLSNAPSEDNSSPGPVPEQPELQVDPSDQAGEDVENLQPDQSDPVQYDHIEDEGSNQ